MAQPVPITTPTRVFEDRTHTVYGIADVPYSQRFVTSSEDRIVRLWDLKTGEVLKKMEGHTGEVMGLVVSRDGQMIVTGDENGELIAWQAKTGESLTGPIKVHGSAVRSVDFSPDDAFVVTASSAPNDQRVRFWNTKTWAPYPGSYDCGSTVRCVRYARSGVYMLAVATDQDIQIYVSEKLQKRFKGHTRGTLSLAWSPDRTRLFSGGDDHDSSIREWDTSSWTQVGLPWTGHTYKVNSIAINSLGTHAVSASSDNTVRLWQLSDKRTIAIFQHTSSVVCAAFSADGTHILTGGYDKRVTEWPVPLGALPAVASNEKLLYTKVVEPVVEWQPASMVPGFDSKVQEPAPMQLVLNTENSDYKPLQAISTSESSNFRSLQPVLTTTSFDSNSLEAVSTTGGFNSNSNSLQAVSTTGSLNSNSNSLQAVSTTGNYNSNSNSLQTVSTTESLNSNSNSLQAVSTTGSFDSTSLQAVSTIGSVDSTSRQAVLTTGNFDSTSLQAVSTIGSLDSTSRQAVLTTGNVDSTSLQAVSTIGSLDSTSRQAVLTTGNFDSTSLQAVSTIGSLDSTSRQAVLTTGNFDSTSLQAVSTIGSVDSTSRQAVLTTGNFDSTSLQAVSTIGSVDSTSRQAVLTTGSFDSTSRQAVSTTTSSDSTSQQAFLTTGSFDSTSRQAVSTTGNFDSTSRRAVLTTESFDSMSRQSSSTIQSVLNQQSVSRAEQYVTKSEQAASRTLVITTDELLAITKAIRTASITGDLYTAEKVLTQEITADARNFASYANRSFVMARKLNWEKALKDANKSLAIRTSLAGYIAKGIALCGKQLLEDARTAFDLAFTFTLGNMDATVFLYLIKAIALFNSNRHKEALLRVEQLFADPSTDSLTCGVVVASLQVQLGTIAFNGARHSEAIEHFTAAVKASTFLAKSAAPAACEAFTVLFGWDIGALWQTSNEKLILALLGAGRLGEAFESYRFAMNASDEATQTSLHSWVLTLSL